MGRHQAVLAAIFATRSSKRAAAGIGSTGVAWLALCAGPSLAQVPFTVTSTDLRDGATVRDAQIYNADDCKGGKGSNASPQLSWHNAPAGTKSFAVTIFDVDAPGPGWWHWAVAGIPSNVQALPSNASASGYLKRIGAIEARNDYGDVGYGGPCPPPGKPHHYIVTVYALDTADLRLGPARHALMFDHEINTAVLAKARLTVTYGR